MIAKTKDPSGKSNVMKKHLTIHASSLLPAFLVAASLFLVTGVCRADVPTPEQECRLRNSSLCEINGIQYLVDGPCKPPARTIRPPGHENCGTASQIPPSTASSPSDRTKKVPSPKPLQDLAWVGRIERWLLPAMVFVGGLLIVGAGFVVFRGIRAQRDVGNSIRSAVRPALQLSVSAIISAIPAFYTAALAFQRVFSGYDNHDSAGPFLIAAPVAFVVFMLAWFLGLLVIFLLLEWVLKAFRKRT
jgi:hypothetical protein